MKIGDRRVMLLDVVEDTSVLFDRSGTHNPYLVACNDQTMNRFHGPWDYVPKGTVKHGELVVLELVEIQFDIGSSKNERRLWKVVEGEEPLGHLPD
jgi:hypothetical protein